MEQQLRVRFNPGAFWKTLSEYRPIFFQISIAISQVDRIIFYFYFLVLFVFVLKLHGLLGFTFKKILESQSFLYNKSDSSLEKITSIHVRDIWC